MADPHPQSYIVWAWFVVFRLLMSALSRLAGQGGVMLGRLRVLMGTATGLAFTYSAYRSVTSGTPPSLLKCAECKKKKPKKARVQKTVAEEPEVKPRDGLTPRPDDAVYLDLAASARCQPSVTAHERAHALFLWIRVKREADPREVACRAARLQQYVQEVEAPAVTLCGDVSVLAGVGFGPEFYREARGGPAPQTFSNAKHSLISGSSVGGDILVHAKSNDKDLLQQLCKSVLSHLPRDSVLCHEVTYATTRYPQDPRRKKAGGTSEEEACVLNYQYTQGDMELFPPSHPVGDDKPCLLFVSDTGRADSDLTREGLAMDPKTGGSYSMTQRWVHDDQPLVSSLDDDLTLNDWVDQAWEDCARPPGERRFKSPTSMTRAELVDSSMERWVTEAYKECLALQKDHPGSSIVCTPGFTAPRRPFRILRQSLPYRSPGGESGLFFVSYASTPLYNELLLERLVRSACGGGRLNSACRNVFRLSRNVSSACWYFPGLQELRELE